MSFLRSVAEVQGHLAHVYALALRVKRVYFIGSFISMELMRRYLSEEINGRNLLRPEVRVREVFPISTLQEEHSLLTGPQFMVIYLEKISQSFLSAARPNFFSLTTNTELFMDQSNVSTLPAG